MVKQTRIRIIPQGDTVNQVAKKLKTSKDQLIMAMELFGEEIAEHMRSIITSSKKDNSKDPSLPTIEDNIRVEVYANRMAVGIVDTDLLDKVVPYWKLVNNGGQIPGVGHFVPGGFGDGTERPEPGMHGGTFVYDTSVNGGFVVTPGMVMPAMNFIERTQMWASRRAMSFLKAAVK